MQQYIYKEPDYAGGFVYTCIEDNHIVRRDNNWNILAVKPIDYVQKGLKTKHGIIEEIVNDRVMLKSLSGEKYTCDKYLLNCSIIKERQKETALRKSILKQFRGGSVMNKSAEFEKDHPRDNEGRFIEKHRDHSRVKKDFEYFKKHCTGKYQTPIGEVEVKPSLFRKMIAASIGEEVFSEAVRANKIDWDKINYNSKYSEELILNFKELLTNPDEILDIKQHLGGDYLFILTKDEKTYHAAISKDEAIINYHNFRKKYIKDKNFEVVYRKEGLEKSIKIINPSFLQYAQRGNFCTTNLAKSGSLVKSFFASDVYESEPMNKGLFNLPNPFRRKKGGMPNPESSTAGTGGVAWNVKGGQKPGHKYIERRPSKTNPDKYIYLYELPNGDRQWRDDSGNEVDETQGQTLDDFTVGDYVKVNDDHYMIESASDNFLGLVDNQGNKFHIDKAKMKQIAEYENTLNIGDTYQKEGSLFDGMKIVGISDQYMLLRSKDGNSQHLVNRADTVRISHRDEIANPYEFDADYRENQKQHAEAGYIQTDINKWEQNVVLGYNTVKHEIGFNKDTGEWYTTYNGKDSYNIQYDGKVYSFLNMNKYGQAVIEDEQTGEKYAISKAELAAGRPITESSNRVEGAQAQTRFWENDPNADIMDAINSVKDHNPSFSEIAEITGKSVEEIKSIAFDYVQSGELNHDGDWEDGTLSIGRESAERKIAKKEKPKKGRKKAQEPERPKEPSKELLESAKRREELLQNPEYTSGRARLESEGFSMAGDDALMTKKMDVNKNNFVVEKKFNPETNQWEGRVSKGRYKTVMLDGKEYTITDITLDGVEFIDTEPDGTVYGRSKTWEELEAINGKRLFMPTVGDGIISRNAPTKIYFQNQDQNEEAVYEVVELKSLIPSHNTDGSVNPNYNIQGAQNRDRSDERSREQFVSIATKPNFDMLSDSRMAGDGSPIVNQNYNVIAGNGRAIGIGLHYDNGGDQYKKDLIANAERLGFDPEEVALMEKPVIVRKVNVSDQRAVELGNLSNRDVQLTQSQMEQARSVARTMKPRTVEKISELFQNTGDKSLAEVVNSKIADIVKLMISDGVISQSEVSKFYNTQDNSANADQKQAVRAIITQLVVGDSSQDFEKLHDTAVKGITAGAPAILSMRGKPGDLQQPLQEAIKLANRHNKLAEASEGSDKPLKKGDTKSFLALASADMYDPINASPEAIAIYESLMKDKQTDITKKLNGYIELIAGDMFNVPKQPEEAFKDVFKINYPDGIRPEATQNEQSNQTGDDDNWFTPPEDIGEINFDDDSTEEEKPKDEPMQQGEFVTISGDKDNFKMNVDHPKEGKKPEKSQPKNTQFDPQKLPKWKQEALNDTISEINKVTDEKIFKNQFGEHRGFNAPTADSYEEGAYYKTKISEAIKERKSQLREAEHKGNIEKLEGMPGHSGVDKFIEGVNEKHKRNEELHGRKGFSNYDDEEHRSLSTKYNQELNERSKKVKEQITERSKRMLPEAKSETDRVLQEMNNEGIITNREVAHSITEKLMENFAPTDKQNSEQGIIRSFGHYAAAFSKITQEESEKEGARVDPNEIAELVNSKKYELLSYPSERDKAIKEITEGIKTIVSESPRLRLKDKVRQHLKEQYEKNNVDYDDDMLNEDADYFSSAAKEQGFDDKKLYNEVLANHIKKMKRERPKQEESEEGGLF